MLDEFQLLRPYWLLALIPLALVLWFWRRHRGGNGRWQEICDSRLLPYLLINSDGRERRFPLLLAGLAGFLAILAQAGPAWQRLEQPVFRESSALVIAFDLSRSMDSTDLTPNRLTRARLKLLDLLDRRREGQTALIAFAGRPFAVTPLTDDTKTIASLAQSLETDLMPSPGSRADLALDLAGELLLQAGARQGEVLLIGDSAEGPRLDAAVQRLTQAGHRLHLLAVGTEDGAPIPVVEGGFLKDSQGAIVVPRLEESALRELADRGNGSYQRMTLDDRDLDRLMAVMKQDPLHENAEHTELQVERWREEGPWLLLLLLPLAALAFRRGYLVLAAFLLLPPVPPPAQALDWPTAEDLKTLDWNDLWLTPNQRGARLMAENQPAAAAEQFQDPRWQAAAHYRAGAFEPAVEALQGSGDPEDSYNLGNALARAGRLQEALEAYTRTLSAEPGHEDARYNRDLVEQALRLEQPPQPQNPQDGEGEKDRQQQGERSGEQGQQQKPDQGQGPSQNQPQGQQKPDASQTEPESGQSEPQDKGEKPESARPESGTETNPAQPEVARPEPAAPDPESSKGDLLSYAAEPADFDPEQAEDRQATAQWLRRIPDDPGGLLRRKFRYQYQQQAGTEQETQTW